MKDASLPVIAATLLLAVTFQTGLATNSFAQDTTTATTPARNSVFIELWGNNLFYSLNYDRKITDRISLRVGLGGWREDDLILEPAVLAPIMVNFLGGEGSEHRVELGAGINTGVWWKGSSASGRSLGTPMVPLWPTAALGYRYQAVEGGWLFRANFTHTFFQSIVESGDDQTWIPTWTWFGISIGYTW